jgi:hypothetical protein
MPEGWCRLLGKTCETTNKKIKGGECDAILKEYHFFSNTKYCLLPFQNFLKKFKKCA